MLSTACSHLYPQAEQRPPSPSIPTMFEHECIITRFEHSVKRANKDPDSIMGIPTVDAVAKMRYNTT